MNILLTGGTGFVGKTLARRLAAAGHTLIFYVRNRSKAAAAVGRDKRFVTDLAQIPADETIDAFINLAGESIAGSLWTAAYRHKLLNSRIATTEALTITAGGRCRRRAKSTSASVAGYYGDGCDRWLGEDAPSQDIFMSTLCRRWEETARQVESLGVRLVVPRISVVLGSDGGAFPQLVRPVRFGLGAVLGSGKQYFPWIHKHDLVEMIVHFLDNDSLSGPYNAVAPDARTQRDFNRVLARQLRRPLLLWAPAMALKLPLGELSDLFLKSQRMSAERIVGAGFAFQYGDLETAAADLLGRKAPSPAVDRSLPTDGTQLENGAPGTPG